MSGQRFIKLSSLNVVAKNKVSARENEDSNNIILRLLIVDGKVEDNFFSSGNPGFPLQKTFWMVIIWDLTMLRRTFLKA